MATASEDAEQSQRYHSNGWRSERTTPVIGTIRLPSRSNSPSRLRSLPSVGLSSVDVLSDAAVAAAAAALTTSATAEEEANLASDHIDDEKEDAGRDKELQLPPPRTIQTCTHTDEAIIKAGISDYTFIPADQGGLLGKGKFSSVQLAWKHGVKYAVKITPLYPHHNLIATRLLREPTILAQLPLHPNLVKVYESIRTPGHFYLVEEYLDGYINLESFVSSQPGQRLTPPQAMYVLKQLVSVVRSALHKPIQIAHRDIKPENVLIHPTTLRIILLDFGLATHFSEREPRLTTCCGSPAFHAPELFLSLRSPPGSVRYWGPEIDIWTIGVTILRCLTGIKYPLGVGHTSFQHLADKTIDSILSVQHKELRQVLAGLLDMDGNKRIEFFRNLPQEIDNVPFKSLDQSEHHDQIIAAEDGQDGQTGHDNQAAADTSITTPPSIDRQFKNTTFLPMEPKYTLALALVSPPDSPPILNLASQYASRRASGYTSGSRTPIRSRSHSKDRLYPSGLTGPSNLGFELSAINERLASIKETSSTPVRSQGPASHASPGPVIPELLLLNPRGEPAIRAISFVKYALRCAGIIYHCQPHAEDLTIDEPSCAAPPVCSGAPILHCVWQVPKTLGTTSPAANLLHQLRPPMVRSATAGPASRSSSTPARSHQAPTASNSNSKKDSVLRCLEIWVQIVPVYLRNEANQRPEDGADPDSPVGKRSSSRRQRAKSRSRRMGSAAYSQADCDRKCTKIRVRVSDERALDAMKKALAAGHSRNDYAALATPLPFSTRLPDVTAAGTNGNHEDEEGRGRPKLPRSRDSDSRSPPAPPTQVRPIRAATQGQASRESSSMRPKPRKDPIVDGLHEIHLDGEEVLKIQDSKRGFFDFVTFGKRSTPATVMTAPNSPRPLEVEEEDYSKK